jgi:hypothetical protein
MRVFPRRVVLKYLAQACSRRAVSAAFFMGIREGQEQLNVEGCQAVTSLRAPVLVAILWEKLAPVRRERTFIAGDISLPKRALRKAFEVIRINPDTLPVQRDHRVRQREVGGALSRQELRLERAASRMQCLAKAVERRIDLGVRPEDLQDLLPMQAVTRVRGEQLRQRLRGTPLPASDRPGDPGPLDPKSSQQFESE